MLVLPRLAFAMSESERRFLSPDWSDGRAKNVSLDGQALKGARGAAADLAAAGGDDRPLCRQFGGPRDRTLPRLRAACEASANELSAAAGSRTRGLVAQGRFAPSRRCVSVAAQWRRADPAGFLERQPGRATRLARGGTVRIDGENDAAADFASAARSSRRAGDGARDEGPSHGIRPRDAWAPRSREGRRCVPARLRAGDRALRAGDNLALLFRSGHACGRIGPVHARADDPLCRCPPSTSPNARRSRSWSA